MWMMKDYFDIDKQIVHLAIDKSVMFRHSEITIAEKILRDSNYKNFVSCSKIKFAELIGSNLIMYKTASFKDWQDYFEMDKKISKHLVGNLLDFELTLNSRVSHYMSELMASSELTSREQHELVQIIKQIKDRNNITFSKYNGQETWNYVSKMTFGEMKQLVFWFHDKKPDVYAKIIEGYSFLSKNARNRLNELNHLRNSLFHLTPLTIYLTYGVFRSKKLNNNERKKVVRWILKLRDQKEIKESLSEICANSDNYVKIKNSLQNVG